MKIGIVGPVSSGKTTFTEKMLDTLTNSCVIHADDYFYPFEVIQQKKTDYDQPDAIDVKLLYDHIKILSSGKNLLCAPKYSFDAHESVWNHTIESKEHIIIEGHMCVYLLDPSFFDLIIYIDTHDFECFQRRIKRIRDETNVVEQHFTKTLPAQKKYVEPQREHATLCVNSFEHFVFICYILFLLGK